MVIVGLILLLLAAAVIAFMVVATQGMAPVDIDYGILNISISPLWLFLAGGLTLAVATSALWLIGVGIRRATKKRAEVKELRKQALVAERKGADTGRGARRSPAVASAEAPSGANPAASPPASPAPSSAPPGPATGAASTSGETSGPRAGGPSWDTGDEVTGPAGTQHGDPYPPTR